MNTLNDVIPDVDVLLALAPEELAPILLRLARAHLQSGGIFDPASVTETTIGTGMATTLTPVYLPLNAAKGDPAKALSDFREAARLIPASDPHHDAALARIADLEKQLGTAAPAAAPR